MSFPFWELSFDSAHKWQDSESKLFPQGTKEFRVFVYVLVTNKTKLTFKNSSCALWKQAGSDAAGGEWAWDMNELRNISSSATRFREDPWPLPHWVKPIDIALLPAMCAGMATLKLHRKEEPAVKVHHSQLKTPVTWRVTPCSTGGSYKQHM